MKVIAWYLPQFHEIPENNEWWGTGFTEWVNVKKAKPLEEGHNQPRIPLNDRYYDLSDVSVQKWQIETAKKYGVYGFCMHHYWFDGKLLLEKPIEQYLKNKGLDFPFCICWANEHWTNRWIAGNEKILIEQKYGNKKEWKDHFEYLLPFFRDERYIRIDGKPFMVIYRPELIDCINDMLDYWQKLAKLSGLPGITFAYQGMKWDFVKNKDDSRFAYDIEYQPLVCWNGERQKNLSVRIQDKIPKCVLTAFAKPLNVIREMMLRQEDKKENVREYEDVRKSVVDYKLVSEKSVPGAFVDWDNTPRKGMYGTYLRNSDPKVFQKYFEIQVKRAREVYHKDFMFVFSWNEWAEGGYLEPDQKNQYGYLEAIRDTLDFLNERENVNKN